MADLEKVIKGLNAHADGCGHRSHYCDVVECPYRYWDESCNIEEMCHDAIALLKKQDEEIEELQDRLQYAVEVGEVLLEERKIKQQTD